MLENSNSAAKNDHSRIDNVSGEIWFDWKGIYFNVNVLWNTKTELYYSSCYYRHQEKAKNNWFFMNLW